MPLLEVLIGAVIVVMLLLKQYINTAWPPAQD
jgi:hypothetical protein